MRLKQLIKTILLLTVFTLFYWVASPAPVYAQACGGDCSVVVCDSYNDPETGNPILIYCSACGGNGCESVGCPSGTYRAPDGSCRPVAGSCECGEFYACPTANNPGKQCACCPAEAACRNARVDCPPGSVRTNTVASTTCSTVNGEGICGGIGNAQRAFSHDASNCCRWVDPPQECGDWYNCPTANNPNKMCRDCEDDPGYCTNPLIRTYTCVSTCNTTAPTNLTVVQGSSPTVANLSWTSGTNGLSQLLRVDEDLAEVNSGCPTPGDCVVNTSITPFTASTAYTYPPITGLLPNTTYYFRVVTYKDNTCSSSAVSSYTTPANNVISGNVYLDTNNTCSTTTPLTTAGMTAAIQNTAYSGSVTNGTFSFTAGVATSYSNLTLSGIPAGYSCSTASGCNHCLTLSTATSGSANNFFITPQRDPWWQAVGAGIYVGSTGGGNTLRSELPSASTPLIAPGAGGAIGALLRASGTVDTGVGSVSSLGYSTLARYRGKIMNYEYFVAHMGVLSSTPQLTNLDSEPTPGADFYYKSGDSTVEGSGVWDVASGESYVIFIDGDLTIDKNITVDNGGFLAFIVSGDVRVDPSVTNMEGLYLMNGSFISQASGGADTQLDVAGSVVAWGGVSLGRDLDTTNITEPAEQFTYRPDLLVNMPDNMKVFALRWQEVVPGTFGN